MPRVRPAWLLLGMVTRPSFRRQGAAGLLVAWGVDQARKMGALACLEASTDGQPVYERYGFKQVGEHVRVDCKPFGIDGSFDMALMIMDPENEVV